MSDTTAFSNACALEIPKEFVPSYQQKYRESHKKEKWLYSQQYYQLNKAKLDAAHMAYRRANPEKHRAYTAAYRARKRAEAEAQHGNGIDHNYEGV